MARPLLPPAIVETALVIYRDVKAGNAPSNPVPYLPRPNQLLAVVIIYGTLGSLPDRFARPAQLLGWGFVIATALNVFNPATVGSKVQNAPLPTVKK